MMKHIYLQIVFLLAVLLTAAAPLSAEDILRIIEGYGQDSVSAYTGDDAQEEAARLFNLILEPDGEIVADRAEQYLAGCEHDIVKAYLCVMLADYAFVNKRDDNGLHYLRRAVNEHDPIRNDSYYRLVLSRAQKLIAESPGREQEQKESVLNEFSPEAVKNEPPLKTVSGNKVPPARQAPELTPPVPPAGDKEDAEASPAPVNYRIQVGAYSVRENAMRRKEHFESIGYAVVIEVRQGSGGDLFLVRIGAYEAYGEARRALTLLKEKYPSEEGIVVKVAEK